MSDLSADLSADSDIMEELENLFSWNPPPYSLATKEMGGSFSMDTRDPTWYDLHLAPDRICKRIVHVKDLHKKITRLVDEKLQEAHDRGITLQPPTASGFHGKDARDDILLPMGNPMRNEQSVVEYYIKIISFFCIPIASSLALHPQVWKRLLVWSQSPVRGGDAICDGSLQFPYKFHNKRTKHGSYKKPNFIGLELWQEMMEVHNKYGDIVTWEMKSLSVGDAGVMLGVMAMATGKEPFRWTTCPGGKGHKSTKKMHRAPETVQLSDDPVTMHKLIWDDLDLPGFSTTDASQPVPISDLPIEDILDQALRRGGSSLEHVLEFDRMLMREAKGLVPVPGRITDDDSQVTERSSRAADSQSGALMANIVNQIPDDPLTAVVSESGTMLYSATQQPGQVEAGLSDDNMDPKSAMTAASFLRSLTPPVDEGPSSNVNESQSPRQRQSRPSMRKVSRDQTKATLSSKEKGLKLTIPTALRKKGLLKRKSTRSKSPKKRGTRGKGRKVGEGDAETGTEEGEAGQDPLTAQSIIQQAWAQGVQTRSTFFVIHSGNYEYICIRHRATQTLYVSDILHVPFLPGYMKLQVGLYIAGLDDAFRRHRQEKAMEPGSSDDDGGQGPGPTDHDRNNSSDNDDDDDDDQPKPKRRRGDEDRRNPKGPSGTVDNNVQNRAMQQAKSRDVLLIYLTYGVYDSIHPATFSRGARLYTGYGLVTPGTLTSPSPFSREERECALLLTSEMGQRSIGVLHGGVLQVELEGICIGIEITAKLAFTNEHQKKLFHEWSVYIDLESRGVVGIPPILGIFHQTGEKGPSCLLLQHFGTSIVERPTLITPKQCLRFQHILDSIHEAGILHGNLRLDNLLVNAAGDVAIVDFDQAQRNSNPKRYLKESKALECLLEAVVGGPNAHITT